MEQLSSRYSDAEFTAAALLAPFFFLPISRSGRAKTKAKPMKAACLHSSHASKFAHCKGGYAKGTIFCSICTTFEVNKLCLEALTCVKRKSNLVMFEIFCMTWQRSLLSSY